MVYSAIHHTDLIGSRIVLGTDRFGSSVPESVSFDLLDRYAGCGGNVIDTASVYADWLGMGKSLSEKTIGKWLDARKNRAGLILSTKGGHYDLATRKPRLSLSEVRSDLESSLENLRTDKIDLYWLHKDDETQSPESLIEMLNEADKDRNVRYFGASNWTYDRIKAANDHAKKNSLRPFVCSQILHSIAKVNYTDEGILAMTEDEYGKYASDSLSVFCFSSQARGFFAKLQKGGIDSLPPHTKKAYCNEENLALYERLCRFAKERSVSVAAAVLALLYSDEEVNSFALIGPGSLETLDETLAYCNLLLSPEERTALLYERQK